MTDLTDDPIRQAEALLAGIVRHALERYAETTSLMRRSTAGAADSVLAALADELPDGYDALLENAHRHVAP